MEMPHRLQWFRLLIHNDSPAIFGVASLIAFVRGLLAEKNLPYVVVEAGGVGYQIEVSLFTFEKLPEIGAEVKLLTRHIVREDAQLLYGFHSADERSLFIAITKVSGFGPRITMNMLSGKRPTELVQSIQQGNKAMLQKIPGIGSKSADRLIVELRDKLGDVSGDDLIQATGTITASISDAEAALLHLGYKQTEINKAIRHIDADLDTATIVRMALKQLSPGV